MSACVDGCSKRWKKHFPLRSCRVDDYVIVSCHRRETMLVADVYKDRVSLVTYFRYAASESILVSTREADLRNDF